MGGQIEEGDRGKGVGGEAEEGKEAAFGEEGGSVKRGGVWEEKAWGVVSLEFAFFFLNI